MLLAAAFAGGLHVAFLAPNVVRLHEEPRGTASAPTEVLDPHAKFPGAHTTWVKHGSTTIARTADMVVTVQTNPLRVTVADAQGHALLTNGEFGRASLTFNHGPGENFYGIDGYSLPSQNVDVHQDVRNGVLRFGGRVSANAQGDGGAPLIYTNAFGVLVDSDGGSFVLDGDSLAFTDSSRPDVDAFIILGPPEDVMGAVAMISGHPPMSPKWTLGFLNSQWGTTESAVRGYVRTYRAKGIPLDAFILDFDWKAWGEDDYGEWRWNSTRGAGNVAPDKFPDGASGSFAAEMAKQGVKLVGIFKPRILLTAANGYPTAAAAYATSHHFWYPGEKPYEDYFSRRQALDIDFANPQARSWYWEHAEPAYRAGIAAFWNDEADENSSMLFDNFQFLNMERAFYDGVRSTGNRRVWSLNRNFYLGAQRYGYAEWSGDISSGFDSMRDQTTRMLSTIDLGEAKWSMDTGGFYVTPSDENYARWMEFAAFVPIMRVHCTFGLHREPWYFGPPAEADAKRAILLRYTLLPYIYSYDREAYERNVGIVRPLFWEFPDVATDTIPYVDDQWMFGKWLMVAPILDEGQAHRSIYLPPGEWIDYFRGRRYSGGKWIEYAVDPNTWRDIPLFIRDGAIVPTQTPQQYVGERAVREVTVDVFPSKQTSEFTYYDDDGVTYAYESRAYFKQRFSAERTPNGARLRIAAPTGSFRPALQTYIVRLHVLARMVEVDGSPVEGWTASRDRYGPVAVVRVRAGTSHVIDAIGSPRCCRVR